MLKPFEYAYLLSRRFLPPLYERVRRELLIALAAARQQGAMPRLLDVGGRKSHYTIGLPADVTITDVPRVTDVQVALHLGLDDAMTAETRARRTNVREIRFDDMTRTALPPGSFDIAVAVEVLEHVDEDARFVENIERVLAPGGVFVMTTPNGDHVRNTNPDHKRHYRRSELQALLQRAFADVRVEYTIRESRFRTWGLASWSARRPLRTVRSMLGNVVSAVESSRPDVCDSARGTCHLIAIARKTRS